MPIENAVAEALNAQMGRELEAHLQYLSVSSWFDAEGLPELHRFFAAQAAEEHAHAMKFLTYIQDAGGRVAIPGLAAPKADFESAFELVKSGSALPVIDSVFPLAEAQAAHERLESGAQLGKVLLRIPE